MGFNSRTREGCDRYVYGYAYRYFKVSIHAPGRGATLEVQLMQANVEFQFTHPGGVRLQALCPLSSSALFQFTHPGGVRHADELLPSFDTAVSIHAPGRGATEA